MASFELLFDTASNEYLLYQAHTEERVSLGGGPVHLGRNEAGVAYVAGHDWSRWAESYFKHQVVSLPDESLCVVDPATRVSVALIAWQQDHIPVSVGISSPGNSAVQVLEGFLLRHRVNGCQLFLSLKQLHEVVLGTQATMTANRWYHSWWPHWEKRMLQLSIPGTHLRRASITGHGGRNVMEALRDPHRFWPEPTASLYALLPLVARFTSPSKGAKKQEETQAAWTALLASLLRRCLPQDFQTSLHIYLDTTALVAPGYPARGNNLIPLPLQGTVLNVSPLLASDLPLAASVRALALPYHIELVQLLSALETAGRKMQWLTMQVLHSLASVMEQRLCCDLLRAGAASSCVDTASVDLDTLFMQKRSVAQRRGAAKRQLQLRLHPSSMSDGPRKLLKYMLGLREHFRDQPRLHVSFDASRVAGRNRLLGFMTRPDNIGAWLPPQVLL
eukprot:2683899-Amphidinium_carterae.3